MRTVRGIIAPLAFGVSVTAATRALLAVSPALPDTVRRSLERLNHRQESVSLVAGPIFVLTATAGAVLGARSPAIKTAAAVAGLGAGAVGLYDDLVGGRSEPEKGFRGHLGALARGRISTGTVKILGIGLAGLIAGRTLSRNPWDAVLAGGVIAGTANLVNLLDLRPGRALKSGVLLAVPLASGPAAGVVAGTLGASAGLLPADLGERTMLGDTGANALGALLGVALAASTDRRGRAVAVILLAAATAASEKVSFTSVIERTPVLRDLDKWGRRAAPASPAVLNHAFDPVRPRASTPTQTSETGC